MIFILSHDDLHVTIFVYHVLGVHKSIFVIDPSSGGNDIFLSIYTRIEHLSIGMFITWPLGVCDLTNMLIIIQYIINTEVT